MARETRISLAILAFFLLIGITLTPIHGCDKRETGLPKKADTIFSLGQVRVYEVTTPKSRFVGHPGPTIIPGPPRFPTKPEHFQKRFIRGRVTEKRLKEDKTRVVLTLDEISRSGEIIREAIYFAYFDVLPDGARMLCKNQDDGRDGDYLGTNYDLPFPFTCTRPPALGFLKGTQDGYLDRVGRGVVYTKEAPAGGSPQLQIKATYFDKDRGSGFSVRWCGSEAAELAKEDAEARVLFHETQKWERADDWLWVEMERTDKDGNILMHCWMIEPETLPDASSSVLRRAGASAAYVSEITKQRTDRRGEVTMMANGPSMTSPFQMVLGEGFAARDPGVSLLTRGPSEPSAASAPPISFSAAANRTTFRAGEPILIRLTIGNTSDIEYKIGGGPGWGRQLAVMTVGADGKASWIPPDVPHFDTDLGPMRVPPWFFVGSIAPQQSQHVLYMIETREMKPGPVAIRAALVQRRLELWTPDVSVEILKAREGEASSSLSPNEQSFLHQNVGRCHNGSKAGLFGARWQPHHETLVRLVTKSVASDEQSLACEYALYAGVLQAIDATATPADIKLAEEAAEALQKRFPNSWLRAYAYGMLCTVYLERGNAEKARTFAEKGLKLPESDPLFQNLGIMEKLERLGATPIHR